VDEVSTLPHCVCCLNTVFTHAQLSPCLDHTILVFTKLADSSRTSLSTWYEEFSLSSLSTWYKGTDSSCFLNKLWGYLSMSISSLSNITTTCIKSTFPLLLNYLFLKSFHSSCRTESSKISATPIQACSFIVACQ